MGRYLKFIGFLVLVLALWQTAGNTFIGSMSIDGKKAVDIEAVAINSNQHQQEDACFTTPQLPYLPDAELVGTSRHTQLLTFSRIQRATATGYICALKDWVDKIAQREAALSLHREKLFDATAYYRCQPVCEYYIFTLRRILI